MNDDGLVNDLDELSGLTVDSEAWLSLAKKILEQGDDTVWRVARSVSRRPGIIWKTHGDDIAQVVRITLWQMLKNIGAGITFPLQYEAWEAALFVRARSAVSEWADSGEVTGFSGHSGMARRKRSLYQIRSQLEMDYGRQVDDEEVVEVYNGRLDGDGDHRSHSAPATIADFAEPQFTQHVDMTLIPSEVMVETLVTEKLSTEATAQLIEQCVAEASSVNVELGEIARTWFSPWPDGDLLPATEVAGILGISPARVRNRMLTIRAIFIGQHVVGGGKDEETLAIARTIASAWLRDPRLGRVAELRFSKWSDGELLSVQEISQRLARSPTEISRAIDEISSLLDEQITIDAANDKSSGAGAAFDVK